MAWGSEDITKTLENRVLRSLRALEERPNALLLGISGGVDSMVLLEVMGKLRRLLKVEIVVAHVHHGGGLRSQRAFRDEAAHLVATVAQSHGFDFVTNEPPKRLLLSEADLREFRWARLKEWQTESAAAVATAHHADDLLETRLMRLIRGTGAQGFSAMSFYNGEIVRPLLHLDKQDLFAYAKQKRLEFLEDPSNRKTDAFRNWVREWLTVLDKRHPGGVRNLGRSFEELAQKLASNPSSQNETVLTNGAIDRLKYLRINRLNKKALLAKYCFDLGLKNYTQGHVEELLKRLDDRTKEYTFEMLRYRWSVTPDRIKATSLRISVERDTL
jgi:tRNA(Ile)-lysidine synthase